MAQVGNSENQLGGPYMVQDSDHMSGVNQTTGKAKHGAAQVDQAQAETRQQGGSDRDTSRQQGGERRRQNH